MITPFLVPLCQWAYMLQLYEEAYAEGDFEHWSEDEEHMVDLHHLTAPLARAALRHVYDDALGRPSKY